MMTVYSKFFAKCDEEYLLRELSLANLLNLFEFHHTFGLELNLSLLNKYISLTTARIISNTSSHYAYGIRKQILETANIHANSKCKQVRELLSRLYSQIVSSGTFNFSLYPTIIFELAESPYAVEPAYASLLKLFFAKLHHNDLIVFIECFIKYLPHHHRHEEQTAKLNSFVIQWLLEKGAKMSVLIKLMAAVRFRLFTEPKGYLFPHFRQFLLAESTTEKAIK